MSCIVPMFKIEAGLERPKASKRLGIREFPMKITSLYLCILINRAARLQADQPHCVLFL